MIVSSTPQAVLCLWADVFQEIQVTVNNNMDEGTAIHWHGFLQKNTQSLDGVPGVSQCPIAPGKSFTYTFTAELYGTTWWHAHYSSQYASGLSGPIVVYGPNQTMDYDIDLGPVQLSDHYHGYYRDLLDAFSVPLSQGPVYPSSQNVLINGKNAFDCSKTDLECDSSAVQQYSTFNFTAGKTHRLRLINTSGDSVLKFSIDGHTMQIIANDFVPIQPYETEVVTLAVGQRSDVIVTANNSTNGAYWMRAFAPTGCSTNNGQNSAQGIIYYQDADRTQTPTSSAVSGWDNTYCGNDPLSSTVPVMSMSPGDPSVSVDVTMEGHSNGTHGKWWMNNVTNVIDYNNPILLQSKLGNNTFTTSQNVYQYDSSTKSVRFVVINNSGNPHPMHMHGHNMFILAEGTGSWDGSIVNSGNPQRRDVQIVQANGYLVVQWNQDNPGAWPFHCHIAWHLSLGMAIEVLESPDLIKSQVNIPSTVSQTCRDWWSYTDHDVVDQIDSGI